MEVKKVKTNDNRVRYYLADDDGLPVEAVLKFLKFKDNMGYARNTLRMYCTHLRQYFTYLNEKEKEYWEINIDDLAGFVGWLRNPFMGKKVVPIRFEPERLPQTVNKTVDTIVAFYDYLVRHGEYESMLPEKLVKFIKMPGRNYRSFLAGIAENRAAKSHILKLKEPQMKIKVVTKESATELLRATTNLRDYFLLYLLFETGLRIGEALSLWLEDFDVSDNKIHLKDRGELENQAEIKSVISPRTLDITQELADIFMKYVCVFHTCDVKTNHVLVKITGRETGKAMTYANVDNLFRTLRSKTGIVITPHMFRHTSLSLLYSAGWTPELLRLRAGHKNIYTTINTYVHLSDEDVAEAFHKVASELTGPVRETEVYENE
jgi:integrase